MCIVLVKVVMCVCVCIRERGREGGREGEYCVCACGSLGVCGTCTVYIYIVRTCIYTV